MKAWKSITVLGICLIISIITSWFLIGKTNSTVDESKIKKLVWSEISKDVRDVTVGGLESATVSKFKVEEHLNKVVFENSTIFDYEKYAGKMLYNVTFQCNKNDKTEPYLVYFDPKTDKIVATRWGYIGLD
jgi:hypothetical protein